MTHEWESLWVARDSLVAVHFSDGRERPFFVHAVTNSHVIKEGHSRVIRINTADGKTDVLNLAADEWFHHPDGDDMAVAPIALTYGYHKYTAISQTLFLTREGVEELQIGLGDEVFFLGRFVSHEGRQRNLPTARFGEIAMMPWEPITHPTRGINQESYLVEARSISGYSGSPVFVHIPPLTPRPQGSAHLGAGPFLLGIDWCHLADYQPVLERDQKTPVAERWYVQQNSGMIGVVPSWKIAEVFDLKELVECRRAQEERWLSEHHRE